MSPLRVISSTWRRVIFKCSATFEKWHGCHALFYSVRDDWRFIIWIDDLSKMVKRVKE
jgi:hypothetical protein